MVTPTEPQRLNVDLVFNFPQQVQLEFQQRLRQGLRQSCWAFIIMFGVRVLIQFVYPVLNLTMLQMLPATLGSTGLTLCAWILSRPHSLSLRALRVLEALSYGIVSAIMIDFHWHWLNNRHLQDVASTGDEWLLMALFGDRLAFPWFLQIIIYGSYVPNTWQRCAVVVTGMALLPIVTFFYFQPWTGFLARELYHVGLARMLEWLAIAVAIAVVNAHRLNKLRSEALEARKYGQYVLKKRLDVGGMGEVYLAEHHLLRRPCAIKVIRPEKANDPRVLQRFEREVKAIANLFHPNVVQIYDYGHTGSGICYYAMEYLPGINLEQLVERFGPLPPARVVHVLYQVCSALQEVHQHGLIHRDIKPSNIILCELGEKPDVAKLVDFGIALDAGEKQDAAGKLTQEGMIVGSPLYMSPEQIRRNTPLGPTSDLYCLALVAYHLLTGSHPFQRETVQDIFGAQLRDTVPPLRSCCAAASSELEAILTRCLAKDASERFPDARQLGDALARCPCEHRWNLEMARDWWRDNRAHFDRAAD